MMSAPESREADRQDDVHLIDIVLLFAAMRRRIGLVITLMLSASALGFLASYLVEPKYRVEAVLLPQSGDVQQGLLGTLSGQFGGLAALAGVDLAGTANKNEAIEVLRSRSLAEEFIRGRDLLPVLFAEHWDAVNGAWTVRDARDVPSLHDGVREFNDRVRAVVEDRRTGLVTLVVTWTDAAVAADWADDLVRRANARMRSRSIEETRRMIEFLREKAAEEPSIAVRDALYTVIESQYKSMALASVREDFAFRVIDAATPPDPDDYSEPKRAVFAIVGAVLGLLVAGVVILWDVRRRVRRKI